MRKYGSDLFSKAEGDRELMGLYFRKIASSNKLDRVIKNKEIPQSKKGKTQYFNDLVSSSLSEYMVVTGRDATTTSKIAEEKMGVARKLFGFLEELDSLEFKVLDDAKLIGAIKVDEDFYEIKFTKHRDSGDVNQKLNTVKNTKKHIEDIAEFLLESYNVVTIKNNQITLFDELDNKMSVKITKKNKNLF